MATLALVPPLPVEDTSALHAKSVARVAEAMFARGITPAQLEPHAALAKYIAPLAERIAARGTP